MILFLGKKELIAASMSQLDVHKMLVLSEYTTSSLWDHLETNESNKKLNSFQFIYCNEE